MNGISAFVRFQRKKRGLTQEELAIKAGVGIRFIRELEQGKTTLQLDIVGERRFTIMEILTEDGMAV
jgi:y4mF family transcriptional regulator